MADQNVSPGRIEFEPPPYGGLFIFLMVLLALTSFGLHVGLTAWVGHTLTFDAPSSVPVTRTAFGIPSTTVLPGCSVVWNGELWVSVIAGAQPMAGRMPVRAASSRLIVFDLQTGRYRETGFTLSPAPMGLLVVDDNLWAVSETVMESVQGDHVGTRRPRRGLNQPTKPFLYDGRLAVIDKNRNDVYTLLTWSEGEWTEVAQVDVPVSPNTSPWFTAELRVVSDGHTIHLFYSDAQSLWHREGMELIYATDPVSALKPVNVASEPEILTTNRRTMPPAQMSGWKQLPLATSWGYVWDVALIDGELFAFSKAQAGGTTGIQQLKMRGQNWVNTSTQNYLETASFSVADGSTGYLVTNELRLFEIGKLRRLDEVTVRFKMSEKLRIALVVLAYLTPYLISTCILGLGTWRLMRIYRTPQYLYGKRTVIQASILRRGIARGIDSLMLVFPPVFWFFVAVGSQLNVQQQYSNLGIQNPMLIVLCSIFGMWLGTILVLSYMEGCWGITPGKWLCGIRTLRTTLRPCGMLRALARELMVYADSLLFVTWLPGVIVIAFTRNWQRVGDLTADTVVVLSPQRPGSEHP